MNIREILLTGHKKLREQRAENTSQEHLEALRIGSSGIFTKEGESFGVCHRIALARRLGHEAAPALDTQIMWAAGERNEDTWQKVLVAAGTTLASGEILHSVGEKGSVVVGHPDVVFADAAGNPTFGLELKGIFGYSTMATVLAGRPKSENLIQAAAYSMYLNIPFALCYTQSAWSRMGANQIKPFYRIFYLEWEGETLKYRDEMSDKWISTVITKTGIKDFFELVDEIPRAKDLGPRPNDKLHVDGSPKKYGPCGLCHLRDACDRYDGNRDYDRWVNNVATITGGSNGSQEASE